MDVFSESTNMQKGFRSALVSTKWLLDIVNTKASNHRILDAAWHLPNTGRNAEEEYKLQHIPGALYFDVDACADLSRDLPHMLPTPEVFENYVGDLGINNDTHVIIYDNNPMFPVFSAQRVWWTFRIFGHNKVSVVEGGLQKWTAEQGPMSSEVVSVPKEKFTAQFLPHLVKNFSDIEKNMKDSAYQLVDARPEGRYNGVAPEPRDDIKPGCIPNTKNIFFGSMMDTEKKCMKTPEEMKKLFTDAGVDLNKPLTFTCGSGMTACMLALAAYECGNDQTAIYDGSWTEWYLTATDDMKKNVPTD